MSDEKDRPAVDEPDGNAQHRDPTYNAAGGEDSSAFENVPSGEKAAAAKSPQNAEVEGKDTPREA